MIQKYGSWLYILSRFKLVAEKLMDNADTALYQAKDNGRGCFSYFSAK
jgi:PleD family two-component response regulator